jgi:hypothetical protein
MKTVILSLVVFTAINAFGQEKQIPDVNNIEKKSTAGKNVFKVSPIVFTKGQLIQVNYERQLFGSFTGAVGLAPVFFSNIWGSILYPVSEFKGGVAIDPEFRWYANSDKVMDGFFIGVYNSMRYSKWTNEDELINYGQPKEKREVSSRRTIFGFTFGTERQFGEHFMFDFYSGIGLSSTTFKVKGPLTNKEDKTGGVHLRLNLAFGYRF